MSLPPSHQLRARPAAGLRVRVRAGNPPPPIQRAVAACPPPPAHVLLG
ncbi:hypothetical protein [Alicycliphilus denitrificans]|nr:hypothetical protein [Alicycliphilus denitrificans]